MMSALPIRAVFRTDQNHRLSGIFIFMRNAANVSYYAEKADAGKRRCAHGQWPCSSFLSGTPGGRHYCWKRPCKGSIPSPGCRRGGQRVSESEDTVFHLDTTGEMAFNMENLNIPHEKMVERLKGTLEAGYTDFDGQRYFSIIRWGKAANCMWSVYASMPEVICHG